MASPLGSIVYPQNNLATRLSEIRQKIKTLGIPPSLFAGIELERGRFHIAEFRGGIKVIVHKGKAEVWQL